MKSWVANHPGSVLALLSSLSVVALPSNSAEIDIVPMIVGGEDASINDFDSFASLYIDSTDYDGRYSGGAYCGGTFLTSEYVMTAAHCIEGDMGALLFTSAVAMLESERDFLNADRRRVTEVYIHPDFENNITLLLPNDIAILKLESPASSGSNVNRATTQSYRNVNETFVAVGHGNTRSGVDGTPILQKANLFWVSNADCASNFQNGNNLTDKQVCFSGDVSQSTGLKAGTCQGDSGGPIYWNNNGSYQQVGITSFGPATCGDPQSLVTAAYTEIADYATWIDSVLAGSETPFIVSDEQARLDYLSVNGQVIYTGGTTSSNTSSGGGGGALTWFTSLALLVIAGYRRRLG
ncbi:S1 family peptidase [Vibrio mediterranei]|uniref:Serine protease n=1 Tax=Vibrio mediterranei TaxID=689 RepID=A0ABX5DF52_9VIBR|nr:serine protease [Vibrio mediterranei]PCD89285.1 serine protease [Vibrio mediterranei]PRQ68353.1 serine protease [Vibrio mediterranei]